MKKISFMESIGLAGPQPFGLLITVDGNGKVNAMAISWFTFVSLAQPKMALSINVKGYSNEVLKRTKKATMCLASEKLKKEGMQCGARSGRTFDKVGQFKLELEEAEGFETPVLKDATVCWALEVAESVEPGDHTLFICDIVNTVVQRKEKSLLALDAYSRLDTV